MFRSDPPLPEVFRPGHMTPSAHQPFHVHRPDVDPDIIEKLSDSDSDDHATLADILKDKSKGVDSGSELPIGEDASSCPKKTEDDCSQEKS